MSVVFRTRFDRLQVVSNTVGVSLTKQSAKKECDVNEILKKYKTTGVINHVKRAQGLHGDFSGVSSYHEAMNTVVAAQEAFLGLPAHVRKRFSNDPGNFLEFCEDPANAGELEKLGLTKSSGVPPVSKSEPAAPVSAPVPAAGEGPKT